MEKVNLSEMDDEAVEKWLADQVLEEHRKVRCGEMEPERHHIDGLNEHIGIDIVGKGETVDEYWARGWCTQLRTASRSNVDETSEGCCKGFPTRYRLADLELSKSQRRVFRRNEDLGRVIRPMRLTPKKDRLNLRFEEYRFGYSSTRPLSKLYGNTKYYPSKLMETCVFQGDNLLACSVFQVGERSAFGDMAMYRLEYESRSLGIFTVLLEMQYAKQLGKEYYYLANYSKHNPLYQYKTRFGGLELYDWDNEVWVDFKDESISAMLDQKLPLTPEVAGDA